MARAQRNRRSPSASPKRAGRESNFRLLAKAKPGKKPAGARFLRIEKDNAENEPRLRGLRLARKRYDMKDTVPRRTGRFRARPIPPPASEAAPAGAQRPEKLLERVHADAEVAPAN